MVPKTIPQRSQTDSKRFQKCPTTNPNRLQQISKLSSLRMARAMVIGGGRVEGSRRVCVKGTTEIQKRRLLRIRNDQNSEKVPCGAKRNGQHSILAASPVHAGGCQTARSQLPCGSRHAGGCPTARSRRPCGSPPPLP